MSAGNDCWQFYESGILSSESNCPTELDHGVVVVGLEESGDKPYWLVQNSWGKSWGDQGFIKMAVEDGDGVSGMNTAAEYIDVEEGYPKEGDGEEEKDDEEDDSNPEPQPQPTDKCEVDESLNPLGPSMCETSAECRGERYCSEFGWCQGDHNCQDDGEDDTNPDPQPSDKCEIDESLNPFGPETCETDAECRGDRYCSEYGWCEGEHNCPEDEDDYTPDDDEWTPDEESCAIDELNSEIFRENRCVFSWDCRGNRWCTWDGWCEGDHGCDDTTGN